ncbi:MAG: SEC-C domain-containing protein [Phycisphaerae bacterium]|nr:SEC-C domain-containing protein [Phycisphaerae bacterium]
MSDDRFTKDADDGGQDAEHRKRPRKLHGWNACPCGSGLRFGRCCGQTGDDTCRYDVTPDETARKR